MQDPEEPPIAGELPTLAPGAVPLRDYVVALACLMTGLTLLVLVLLSQRRTPVVVFQILPSVLASIACSAGAGLWLLNRPPPRAWPMLAAGATAGFAGMLIAITLVAASFDRTLGEVVSRQLVVKGLMASPLLGAMVGLSLFVLARARQAELNAWNLELRNRLATERLRREQALADLQLLQAQMEPHFLYNTLANLRQLIRMDSNRALAMLESLIRYFKLVLPSFRHQRVPLGDELALVQTYLDLMRERTERPLHLALNVPMQWMGALVPPGALLCLTENALKHGLPEDGGALHLEIAAAREGDALVIRLRDNGPGLHAPTSAESTGTGLLNLRERLRLSHGQRASVRLQDHAHASGCEAILELPWETP